MYGKIVFCETSLGNNTEDLPGALFFNQTQKVFFFYFQCKKEHFSKKDEKENNFNYRKLNQ